MNDFINELKSKISACGNYEDLVGDGENWTCTNQWLIDDALALIDLVGENARRMLEIGIVQDELVKLGFNLISDDHVIPETISLTVMNINNDILTNICFYRDLVAYGDGQESYYTTPTWQQDVLNKVKELINVKN